MTTLEFDATVNEQGRLVLDTPVPLPPGKVRVVVDVPDDGDDADFRSMVSQVWAESLADPSEDVYTLADGVPIDPDTGEASPDATR